MGTLKVPLIVIAITFYYGMEAAMAVTNVLA